jgi:hypothetical protein
MGQQNVLSKAEDYLRYSSFSYNGLIEQLEFESFRMKKPYMQLKFVEQIGTNRLPKKHKST